ncbi:MAG: TonB family protein [Sphingomonadaceae bacterium]
MEFSNHPHGPGKNLTGLSLVALLHIGLAALLIIGGSRVTIFRAGPPVIEVVPTLEPTPPRVEPDPVAPPEPSQPTIFVPPPEAPVSLPDTPTVSARPLSDKPAADTGSVVASEGGSKVAAPKAAPVHLPAVVDASACSKPDYPKSALRNGDTGTVTLALLVGTDGRVADSRVEKSSGFRELDRAAQVGLGLCKFKPGTQDGVPYQSWTRMQYVWSLND